MNPNTINRRQFFDSVQNGLYGAALASLLSRDLYGVEPHHKAPLPMDTRPRQPHFAPRAKAVIQFCMQGGPSQVDLFDPKPALEKFHGADAPEEFTKVAPAGRSMKGKVMRSHWKFARHGQSGAWVSELLPHTAKMIDEIAIIRSMYNVHENHEPACYKWQSGEIFPGHPTLGAWVTYGLGSVSQNLPAYVVLADPQNRLPVNNVENWMSGYLPPLYQGTQIKSEGTPMLHIKPDYQEPASITAAKRNLINALDRLHKSKRPNQPVLDSRIANYQMAARMQVEASEALDVSSETEVTRELYGIGGKDTDNFGKRCLMARRPWNAACVSCRFIRAAKCGTTTATSKPHCPPPVVKAISLAPRYCVTCVNAGCSMMCSCFGAANSVACQWLRAITPRPGAIMVPVVLPAGWLAAE